MVDWVDEFPGMISVCDKDGKILAMNQKISDYFKDTGGKNLVGSNLFDCHSKQSGEMIKEQMKSQKTIVYTAEEDGQTELVIHAPWFQNGQFAGIVEITVPLEGEIKHLLR